MLIVVVIAQLRGILKTIIIVFKGRSDVDILNHVLQSDISYAIVDTRVIIVKSGSVDSDVAIVTKYGCRCAYFFDKMNNRIIVLSSRWNDMQFGLKQMIVRLSIDVLPVDDIWNLSG